MGKIKKALIKLSKKVTGKDLTNEDSIGDVVNFMADNYEGGGGSEIVDALPASGKEGSTYLLRQSVSFKLYESIFSDSLYAVAKTMPDKDKIDAYQEELVSEFVSAFHMHGIINRVIANVMLESDLEEAITSGEAILFESLESLPAYEDNKSYIHYLGEFEINDFKMCECRGPEGGYYIQSLIYFIEVNGLISQYSIEDNTYIKRYRHIDADENNQWIIGDWEEINNVTIVETLTDELITNSEQFDNTFNYNEGAIITFTPEYSYTQYVFDNGVYTVLDDKQQLYRVGIIFTNKTTNDKYIIICTTSENVDYFDFSDPDIFNKCIELVRYGDLVLKQGDPYYTEIGVVCQLTDFGSTPTQIQMLSSGTLGSVITIDSTNYDVTDTYSNSIYYRPSSK